MKTRENAIVDAIDYQIPVTQLSVLGALRECEGGRYMQVDIQTLSVSTDNQNKISFKLFKNIQKCGC